MGVVDAPLSSCSLALHLDPRQARMMLGAELGLAMGDDAAIFLCSVLQNMIERLFAGALTSCGKPDLRSKYGGTGKDVQAGADVQPRHLQDYIRTDKEMWAFFNSAFAFQVILSVFLDHATGILFQRLGLPVHSKEALVSCEYYATVIDGLQQKKSTTFPSGSNNNNSTCNNSNLASTHLSVTTPAQLARVAAGVNPLCSVCPKACLMTEALMHETFMALCEGVIRSRPDTRVITVADLDGGIRDVFPEELAVQATRAGEEAISALSGETAASPPAGDESAVEHVRVCVRRLQGTRTLLRKTFRVPPGILLFTVFAKACEKLHVNEDGVVFVHDGAILSGWRKAGTLSCGAAAVHRAVQVFVVCKRAWACKQRAAARRGLLVGNRESSYPLEPARKTYVNTSARTPRDRPWQQQQQKQQHPPPPHIAPGARASAAASAATGRGFHATHHHPLVPIHPQPSERTSRSLPPGLGRLDGEEEKVGRKSKSPAPRQARRWITTPAEGTKADLSRLENAQSPLVLRQRMGNLQATGLSGNVSMGALADPRGTGEEDRDRLGASGSARVVMSPRIERTVRRLSAMEECLRNLGDSMKELQSGDRAGRPSGVSSLAMTAITSQLDVAYNLSTLCRQALSSVDDDVANHIEAIAASHGNDQPTTNRSGLTKANTRGHRPPETHTSGGYHDHDGRGRGQTVTQGQPRTREKSVSFLTEVPMVVPSPDPDLVSLEVVEGLSHHSSPVQHREDGALARKQESRDEAFLTGGGGTPRFESAEAHDAVDDDGTDAPQRQHLDGGIPMERSDSGSGHAHDERNAGFEPATEELIRHGGGGITGGGGGNHLAESSPSSPGLDDNVDGAPEEEGIAEQAQSTNPSHAADGSPEEDEEGAITMEDLMCSWGSMVTPERPDHGAGDEHAERLESHAVAVGGGKDAPVRQQVDEVSTESLPADSGHAHERNTGFEPATEELMQHGGGGTTGGGGGDDRLAESPPSPGLDGHAKGVPEEETAEHTSSAYPSHEDGTPEEEQGTVIVDDLMSSWGSMVTPEHDGHVEDQPDAVTADDSPEWSRYSSDFQPDTPPQAVGPPSESYDDGEVDDALDDVEKTHIVAVGAGAARSSATEVANVLEDERDRHPDGRSDLQISGAPTGGAVGGEHGDQTSESPYTTGRQVGERMQAGLSPEISLQGSSQRKGQRVSGGAKVRRVVASQNPNEGGRGGEDDMNVNVGLIKLDAEEETAGGGEEEEETLVAAARRKTSSNLNAAEGERGGRSNDVSRVVAGTVSVTTTALHSLVAVPSEQPHHGDDGGRKTGSGDSARLLLAGAGDGDDDDDDDDDDSEGGVADGGQGISSALSEASSSLFSSLSVAETARLQKPAPPTSELAAPLDRNSLGVSNDEESVTMPGEGVAGVNSDGSQKPPHQEGDLPRDTTADNAGGTSLEPSPGGAAHGNGSISSRVARSRRSSYTPSPLRAVDERASSGEGWSVEQAPKAPLEALPLHKRRSIGTLVPEPDAGAGAGAGAAEAGPGRYGGEGDWDDAGDEEGDEGEDDDGNWASWLGAGGAG